MDYAEFLEKLMLEKEAATSGVPGLVRGGGASPNITTYGRETAGDVTNLDRIYNDTGAKNIAIKAEAAAKNAYNAVMAQAGAISGAVSDAAGAVQGQGAKALAAGKEYGSSALETVKANPIKSGVAVGVPAVAAGGYYALNREASVIDYFESMSKTASELEAAYEKIAEEVAVAAEQILTQYGAGNGFDGVKLHDFVRKAMDEVKTLAAKKDCNLAEAAKLFLAGDKGTVIGVDEGIMPAKSQAPSPVKAPINSNVTADPDQFVHASGQSPLAKAASDIYTSILLADASDEEKLAAIAELDGLLGKLG